MIARDKHSSLLHKSVNYGCNKFYDTGANTKNVLRVNLQTFLLTAPFHYCTIIACCIEMAQLTKSLGLALGASLPHKTSLQISEQAAKFGQGKRANLFVETSSDKVKKYYVVDTYC